MTPQYSKYYLIWIDYLKLQNLKHTSFFVTPNFEKLGPRTCTNYVQHLSEKYLDIRLSPLDYRHLRATHHYHSVMSSSNSPAEKVQLIENYASCVGQSADVLKNHYVYYNPSQLAILSLNNMNLSNELLNDGLRSAIEVHL